VKFSNKKYKLPLVAIYCPLIPSSIIIFIINSFMIKVFFLLIIALSAPHVSSSQSFGLFPTTDQPPLELIKLGTQVKVEGESYAKIQYTFIYKNPFDNPIQTKFVFPPTRNAIFHKFEATIQNQTFTTKIVNWSVLEDLETNNCDPGFQ